MPAVLILIISIMLQLVAAYLALRLLWVTKSRAWVLLAVAIALINVRRLITLYRWLFWGSPHALDLTAELVAFAVSILMVVGLAWIAPLFYSIKRSEADLRLNESRLEALWQLSQMTAAPLKQITDFALEEGVRLTKSKIGYLAFMNEDETVLTMHSWSKTAMEQCAIIDKPIIYPLETTGLWGEAVRQRRPIITNDYETPSPYKKGYPKGHVRVRRHLNLPVFDGAHIVAVAGVGNKEEGYDESDVRQLTLLMTGMWWLIQRKRREEALSAEIEHMHQFETNLIQTSSDGIIANDRRGQIIIFNEGAERILGYCHEEVIGKLSVETLYPPGMARQIKKRIYSPEYGGPGRLVNYETVTVSKSGELIPIEFSASLIFEDDQEMGTVGFFRDLRERKQLQEKLLQSERLAAVGKMAAHISHEIKNPLMAIGGFARQVLRELGEGPEKTREKLKVVVDEVRRLEGFLAEMGSYAKLSEPKKSRGDLNALIQEVHCLLQPSLQESGITLQLELDPGLPPVDLDPVLLRQVLLNLAKNGIEAMKPGGILTIRSCRQEGRVLVQVTDTGKGISPEIMAKIFTPFFSTKPGGSGLGLAICRKIMEAHHGEIILESQPNRGTRVNLWFEAGE